MEPTDTSEHSNLAFEFKRQFAQFAPELMDDVTPAVLTVSDAGDNKITISRSPRSDGEQIVINDSKPQLTLKQVQDHFIKPWIPMITRLGEKVFDNGIIARYPIFVANQPQSIGELFGKQFPRERADGYNNILVDQDGCLCIHWV